MPTQKPTLEEFKKKLKPIIIARAIAKGTTVLEELEAMKQEIQSNQLNPNLTPKS